MQDARRTAGVVPRGERSLRAGLHLRKEISYPPMWRRPDILDPAVMQHEPACEIADQPKLLKHAVTVKKEATYDFATCTVCARNWYAWDQPPKPAEVARS